MNVRQLILAKRRYDIRRKQLETQRFVQLDEFREQFGSELIVRIQDYSSPEKLLLALDKAEKAVAAMEKILAGSDISEEEFAESLGFSKEEFERIEAETDPVIQPVPEKLVLMTFDDAYIDHITTVAPIFEKYHSHANFFVCEMIQGMFGDPGFDDKSAFMTWDQIRDLAERGHEIVNHSWHHEMSFFDESEAYLESEIAGVGNLCEQYGIRKPIAFGYPGGRCLRRHEEAIRKQGYHWARGDIKELSPIREGQSYYDPYMDSPLSMPSYNGAPGFDEKRIQEVLSYATNGRVLTFAYHHATGPEFGPLSLEDQVKCIYDNGGRCITYTELEQYIDPEKAYLYTHDVLTEK